MEAVRSLRGPVDQQSLVVHGKNVQAAAEGRRCEPPTNTSDLEHPASAVAVAVELDAVVGAITLRRP